jgi:glycosyltransferase involved in cell wall biosynthesis
MGTAAFQQARALADLGVEVTVMTPRRIQPRSHPVGVTVQELRAPVSLGNAATLPQVLRRVGGYDVVHLHYPFFGTAELLAARRMLARPPLVLQYQMDVVAVSWKARLFQLHRRLVLPLILRFADAIVVSSADYAASSFLAGHLPRLGPRVVAIPNGVDLGYLTSVRDARDGLTRTGLDERPIVFFLAKLDRTHYFKGLYVLIEALTMVPEIQLLVGGDGEWRGEYEAQARARLGDRAHFLGDVPDELLPAYYRTADVVALPSTDRTEAFGLVLIEAMACGTPVVASRLPGVRTLVEEGRNGYLVEPGDPIDLADKLLRCVRETAKLGAQARDFVAERYGTETIGTQLLDLYRRLCPSVPRPRTGWHDSGHRDVAGFLLG